MVLKNLFKHKVPLFFSFYEGLDDRDICELGYHYSSKWIEDGSKVGIKYPDDLYEKLTPFIRYLISKIRYEIPHLFQCIPKYTQRKWWFRNCLSDSF